MLENFIYAKQKSLFETALNNGEVLDEAIVFIEDTKEIWNHGTYYGSDVEHAQEADYAGVADKLTNARTISLSGGATSTAVAFDGSKNINIPVKSLGDLSLTRTYKDDGRADALSLADLSSAKFASNRLAFNNPDGVLIYKSNDGGATWDDYGATDEQKTKFVSGFDQPIYIGGKTTGQIIEQDRLRVILTSNRNAYTSIEEFLIYITTAGAESCQCRLSYVTAAQFDATLNYNSQAYTEITTKQVVGWSGWNRLLQTYSNAFGYDSANNVKAFMFEFWFMSTRSGYESKTAFRISQLIGIGKNVYLNGTGCKLAETGHMYDYDWQKNVTFPANVTATKHITQGGSANQVVLGDGTLKELSEIGGKTYSVATPDSDGLMSKEDKIKSDLFEYSIEENSLDCNAKINPIGVEVNNSSETLESKLQLTKSEFTGTEDLCLDITSTNTISELPAPIVGRIAVSPGTIGSARYFSFDDGENKEKVYSQLFIDNALSLGEGGVYSKITNEVGYESTIENHTTCVDINSDQYSSSLSIFHELENHNTGEYSKKEFLVNTAYDGAGIRLWNHKENTSSGIQFSVDNFLVPEIQLVKDAQTEVLINSTGITAPKFITKDGTSEQVVLGDGTLKNLSDFNTFDPSILDSKQDKIEDILTLSADGVTSNNTINVKTTTDDGSASNIEILYNDLSDTSTVQQQMNISSVGINSSYLMNFDNSQMKLNTSRDVGIFSTDTSGGLKLFLNYEDDFEVTAAGIKQSSYSNVTTYVSKLHCYTHFTHAIDSNSLEVTLGITDAETSILELKGYSDRIKAFINGGEEPYIEVYRMGSGTTTITPADITSPKFIKTNGTATQVLMADGSVKEISEVGKSYSIATASEDGLMSKGMYSALKDGFIANIVEVTTNGNSVELSYDAAYPNGDGTFNMMEGEGVEIPLATTTSAGVMSKEDKIKLDSLSTSTDGGMTISGTVNLTNGTFNTQNNSSLNSYTKVFNNMRVGEMRMYLVADSSGNLPSTETAVTVPYDGILSPAQVYFGKSAAFGVSVGDICVLFKKSSLLNICRIIPLNDVKPSNGDFPGADGLATVWDKNRINKIDGIEWTVNHVRDTYLPKSDRFPSRADWLINVDYCIDNGVYPTCDTASMNVGWTNQYVTLIVQRTSTADNGGYNTVEQTAYGRGSDEGRIYKRIIFVKSDDSDVQYGQWINIVSRNNAYYHTCKYGSDSMLNFIRSIKYSLINMSNILDGTIHFHSVDDYVGVVSFFKYGDQKCKVIGQTIGSLSHNSIYETGTLLVSYSGFCGTLDLQDDNINNSDCLCATANEDTWKFNGRVN